MLPMKPATRKQSRQTTAHRARGETRFPGIKRHAEALGISRPHLFMVLTGKRESARLITRYRELISAEKTTRAAA
jgi:hypothetical protein